MITRKRIDGRHQEYHAHILRVHRFAELPWTWGACVHKDPRCRNNGGLTIACPMKKLLTHYFKKV